MATEIKEFDDLPECLEHLDNLALLTDVALGDYSDPKEVYEKHGLTKKQWVFLNKTEAFKSAVLRIRSELERSGKMTQAKARLMADDLMNVVYREAMDPDSGVPLEKRLDVLRTFAKLADLEPKQASVGKNGSSGGPAFAIQINLNNVPVQAEAEIVEIEGEE